MVYRLTTPVCRSAAARDKPLRFLDGVVLALRQVFGGDPNYVGLLTKNPLHPCWQTLRSECMPSYSLKELAAAVNPLQKATGGATQPSKAVARPMVQLSRVSDNPQQGSLPKLLAGAADYRSHSDAAHRGLGRLASRSAL